MSQRKLQQDIDKLLKKVKEGIEDFDDIYEKFQSTDPSILRIEKNWNLT